MVGEEDVGGVEDVLCEEVGGKWEGPRVGG